MTSKKSKENKVKNILAGYLAIGFFILVVDYWVNSTLKQKINIVIWWLLFCLGAYSINDEGDILVHLLPQEVDPTGIVLGYFFVLIGWGIGNLYSRHRGLTFKQQLLSYISRGPLPKTKSIYVNINRMLMICFFVFVLYVLYVMSFDPSNAILN